LSIDEAYREAALVLRSGGVVALPTDTVFGLCALAADGAAVDRIYAIKRRPPDQPMPVFVASVEQAETIVEWNPTAGSLAACFWPGALTIVLPKRLSFPTRAAAGATTIGVRSPADDAIREIARDLGPLTGTSANLSGAPECRTADDVRAQLADEVDYIVDAAIDASGQPSTVVDCSDPGIVRFVRSGGITAAALANAVRGLAVVEDGTA
jgi:L-threonylcarbamoyladenylate synthase